MMPSRRRHFPLHGPGCDRREQAPLRDLRERRTPYSRETDQHLWARAEISAGRGAAGLTMTHSFRAAAAALGVAAATTTAPGRSAAAASTARPRWSRAPWSRPR